VSRGIDELLMTADDGVSLRKGHLENGTVLVAYISTLAKLKGTGLCDASPFHFLVVRTCVQN
jgi:hypothetical protein